MAGSENILLAPESSSLKMISTGLKAYRVSGLEQWVIP
jgi:hypothetical protein